MMAYAVIACVASVSNRVTARKLERKQKKRLKGEGREGVASSPSPSPVFLNFFFFFLLLSQLLDEPREETLATQANAVTPFLFGKELAYL